MELAKVQSRYRDLHDMVSKGQSFSEIFQKMHGITGIDNEEKEKAEKPTLVKSMLDRTIPDYICEGESFEKNKTKPVEVTTVESSDEEDNEDKVIDSALLSLKQSVVKMTTDLDSLHLTLSRLRKGEVVISLNDLKNPVLVDKAFIRSDERFLDFSKGYDEYLSEIRDLTEEKLKKNISGYKPRTLFTSTRSPSFDRRTSQMSTPRIEHPVLISKKKSFSSNLNKITEKDEEVSDMEKVSWKLKPLKYHSRNEFSTIHPVAMKKLQNDHEKMLSFISKEYDEKYTEIEEHLKQWESVQTEMVTKWDKSNVTKEKVEKIGETLKKYKDKYHELVEDMDNVIKEGRRVPETIENDFQDLVSTDPFRTANSSSTLDIERKVQLAKNKIFDGEFDSEEEEDETRIPTDFPMTYPPTQSRDSPIASRPVPISTEMENPFSADFPIKIELTDLTDDEELSKNLLDTTEANVTVKENHYETMRDVTKTEKPNGVADATTPRSRGRGRGASPISNLVKNIGNMTLGNSK